MENAEIPFGLKDGKLVHVDEVANGLKCNCVCTECGEKLEACNGGSQKVHYFRHHSSDRCKGAYDTTLHTMVEELIQENKKICIPSIDGEKQILFFEKVFRRPETSKIKQKHGFEPDLVAYDKFGTPYFIEVYVTHECEDYKIEKLKRTNVFAFELDIPNNIGVSLHSKNKIKKMIFESYDWLKVLSSPLGIYEIATKIKISNNALYSEKKILIVNYENTISKMTKENQEKEYELHKLREDFSEQNSVLRQKLQNTRIKLINYENQYKTPSNKKETDIKEFEYRCFKCKKSGFMISNEKNKSIFICKHCFQKYEINYK